MKSLLSFGTILAMVLALGDCSPDQNSFSPAGTQHGTVEGRILDVGGTGKANQLVFVESLNLATITDSAGQFSLSLPEGAYRLLLPDTVIEISVSAGLVSLVPDRLMGAASLVQRKYALLKVEIHSIRDGTETVWVGGPGDLDLWRPIRINADSLYLQCVVGETRLGESGEPVYTPLESFSTISQNGTTIIAGFPPKGRLVTPTVAASGLDTFIVSVDSVVCARFIVVDSTHIRVFTRNQILITTERVVLVPKYNDELWGSYGSGKWMVVGADTFWVNYDRLGSVDWDLYLVNDLTGDTCYWRNPNPDWGVAGAAEDDPVFGGDASGIGWDGQSGGQFYSSDRITIDNPPAGVYSVYVSYFDAVNDTLSMLPRLGLEIGMNPESSQITRFYQNSPSRPLKKGETWFAGTITLPAGVYSPRDQRIVTEPQGLPKTHRVALPETL